LKFNTFGFSNIILASEIKRSHKKPDCPTCVDAGPQATFRRDIMPLILWLIGVPGTLVILLWVVGVIGF
jgi:hypothetical protein